MVYGLSCPMACGIFSDQGSNPCPLHWQKDSYPLYQQGSPETDFCFQACYVQRNVYLRRCVCETGKMKTVYLNVSHWSALIFLKPWCLYKSLGKIAVRQMLIQ
ncbi:unnamed protein product [Rangifer tarandus platyrhynchus]|uniref:Uncharacterized protein n=1 Tax=Rangifer tarandus platyrhynchus TaxID=3082113 RepID=A0AC60A5C3_RANTA